MLESSHLFQRTNSRGRQAAVGKMNVHSGGAGEGGWSSSRANARILWSFKLEFLPLYFLLSVVGGVKARGSAAGGGLRSFPGVREAQREFHRGRKTVARPIRRQQLGSLPTPDSGERDNRLLKVGNSDVRIDLIPSWQ